MKLEGRSLQTLVENPSPFRFLLDDVKRTLVDRFPGKVPVVE